MDRRPSRRFGKLAIVCAFGTLTGLPCLQEESQGGVGVLLLMRPRPLTISLSPVFIFVFRSTCGVLGESCSVSVVFVPPFDVDFDFWKYYPAQWVPKGQTSTTLRRVGGARLSFKCSGAFPAITQHNTNAR